MSDASAYRARSRAVRGAARAHIQRLRADRMARRAEPPVAEAPAPPSDALEVQMTVSHAAAQATRPAPAMQGNGAPAEDGTLVDKAALSEGAPSGTASLVGEGAAPVSEAPPPTEEMNDVDESVLETSADADSRDAEAVAGAEPVLPDPADAGTADTDPRHGDDDPGPDDASVRTSPENVAPRAIERSDLNRLPGAGSGLIWMLQECGVASLADLAQADPDQLRERMGLVGQILDLQDWIEVARAETGSAARD